MGMGPGVDFRGQMPIPQDMIMKRGVARPRGKPKIYTKSTIEQNNKINVKEE